MESTPNQADEATETFAEAKAALVQALARFPALNSCGLIAVPGGNEFDLQGITDALAFLRQCTPAKKPAHSSYWLKHVAEHWAGRYLTNGELIVAAVHLGFAIEPIEGSPNVFIGIDKRKMPTGAAS